MEHAVAVAQERDADVGQRLTGWEKPALEAAVYDFDILANPPSISALEDDWAQLGFAMHYMMEMHPEILKPWLRTWANGGVEARTLFSQIKEKVGEDKVDEDFQRFHKSWAKSWTQPKF